MNRLFLAAQTENITNCYTPEQIGESPVLSNEVFMKGSSYPEVEYLFSTWGMVVLTEEEILEKLPNLKAVFYGAGTVAYFAEPFLKLGIRVFSAWEANANPVAEFTTAQILLANKGYFQQHDFYRQDFKSVDAYAKTFPGNYGTKVGLLGVGMISQKVIAFLKPYDLEILVYSKHLTHEAAKSLGVKTASLEEIFLTCQTISNHLANKKETTELLNYSLFSKMKNNATFINTGRGAQVHKEGLIQAMKEAPYRTALLDVTDPVEPVTGEDSYWHVPNIKLTPHRAGSQSVEIYRMGTYMINTHRKVLQGEPCTCEVTHQMLKTMA